MFTPEFRNRLDAVVSFAALEQGTMLHIVDKFLGELELQLADREVTLQVSSAAKKLLAEKGYDPLYGARPLARVIQDEVKKPMSDELLFGALKDGGEVKVGVKEGELALSYSS